MTTPRQPPGQSSCQNEIDGLTTQLLDLKQQVSVDAVAGAGAGAGVGVDVGAGLGMQRMDAAWLDSGVYSGCLYRCAINNLWLTLAVVVPSHPRHGPAPPPALRFQLVDLDAVEEEVLSVAEARIEHLTTAMECTNAGQWANWTQIRLDRIIADHLLRIGQYDVAVQLAQLAGIEQYVNLGIFETSRVVEQVGPGAHKTCPARTSAVSQSAVRLPLHACEGASE